MTDLESEARFLSLMETHEAALQEAASQKRAEAICAAYRQHEAQFMGVARAIKQTNSRRA